MLVLVTYDVSFEDESGHKGSDILAKYVKIMELESSIPCLSAMLLLLSGNN